MSGRETRDLMNVESLSQLPFIRNSPVKEKPSSGGAIRLFGKEFTTINGRDGEPKNGDHQASTDNKDDDDDDDDNKKNIITSSSTRKFECHYCCRNFPTSQALGGHQNAHKRERQHAKRAHLQSPMMHDYGLLAYNSRPIGYQYPHPWNTSHTRQLYGRNHPSNGSPFATWRIPTAHGSVFTQQHSQILSNHTLSFDSKGGRGLINMPVSGGAGLGYDSKGSMQDHHVSLDLHL